MTRKGWEFSDSVLDKARDYLADGRVRRDSGSRGVFWVRGSDPLRPYRVQTDADPDRQRASWIACTCPHGSRLGAGSATCSHAVAVLLAVRDRLVLPEQPIQPDNPSQS